MSLRDDAVAAVEEAVTTEASVEEYVDTVLDVVRLRLASVVLDLSTHGDLTPVGARVVHRVLDIAGVIA